MEATDSQSRLTDGNRQAAEVVEALIMARRSIRSYSDEPVPESWIAAVLRCGAQAPSPSNRQPVRFVRIASPALRAELHQGLLDGHARLSARSRTTGAGAKMRNRINVYRRYAEFMVHAPVLMAVAAIGIAYAAISAALDRKKSPDRVLIYFSILQMNLVALGVFSLSFGGMQGAVFQLIAHGTFISGLWLLLSLSRERAANGGLKLPLLVMVLAAIGLPGLSGFAGTYWILKAGFASSPPLASLAVAGVLLAAVTMLQASRAWTGAGAGERGERGRASRPVRAGELLALVSLAGVILWMGIFPGQWSRLLEPSVKRILSAPAAALASPE